MDNCVLVDGISDLGWKARKSQVRGPPVSRTQRIPRAPRDPRQTPRLVHRGPATQSPELARLGPRDLRGTCQVKEAAGPRQDPRQATMEETGWEELFLDLRCHLLSLHHTLQPQCQVRSPHHIHQPRKIAKRQKHGPGHHRHHDPHQRRREKQRLSKGRSPAQQEGCQARRNLSRRKKLLT